MGILSALGIGGKTLYYPGCLTKGVLKTELDNYKAIFNKLGIDFIMLPADEVCCGLPILNAGYKKDAKKLAQKNLELFKSRGIKKIITNCPSCYHTFKNLYLDLVPGWKESGIEVEHATVTILNALKKKGIDYSSMPDKEKEPIAYHDPCHLGRYSQIYEQPREVIKRLGGIIIESKFNRENAFCCGAGGGMRANYPEIARAAAKKKSQYTDSRAGKIISPCGLCYSNIQTADERSEEFSSFVLRKLNSRGIQ
ncbi:MAG: (Fe-S)-binding protein [archaeon]